MEKTTRDREDRKRYMGIKKLRRNDMNIEN